MKSSKLTVTRYSTKTWLAIACAEVSFALAITLAIVALPIILMAAPPAWHNIQAIVVIIEIAAIYFSLPAIWDVMNAIENHVAQHFNSHPTH